MLKRLTISNYLLIDALELDLGRGLTIITGETGSGKSIVIGALALAMGERAGSGVQRDPAKRCVIELEVDLKAIDLRQWFAETEIPAERYTILRRQLDANGRSRAFVNDTPVKLEQLRELGERLVHVHSQHHTLLLNDTRFQLGLVDHIAGQVGAVLKFSEEHAAWRAVQRRLADLGEQEARAQRESDYLRFQLEELEAAQLKPDEQTALDRELARAEHAEELVQGLRTVEEAVSNEHGLAVLLNRARQAVVKPARLDPSIQPLLERLNSALIELKDIGEEADRMAAAITVDPERATRLRDRADTLLRLQQKHRVNSSDELITLRDGIRQRLAGIGTLGAELERTTQQEQAMAAALLVSAAVLSKERHAAVGPLSEKVETILKDLGMPNAVFRFELHANGGEPQHFGPQGLDNIRALFSANKDRPPAPLDKVASGGELSRVMLALISLAADSQGLPTVIFDEIDTGVSGEVADRVGALMARMGKERQVLAITHLPQIASKAHTHLLVSKAEEGERTATNIRPVLADERIEALAQMLSGRKLTKAALDNARELLKTAR